MDQDLFTAVDTYISQLFVPPDASLEAARQSAEDAGLPGIHITPSQGKLLYLLALMCGARKILDIGTLVGYSALWMAKALPPDGQVITLEKDATCVKVARENIARAGLSDRIEVRQGEAKTTLAHLNVERNGQFDMVFLDTNDKYAYTTYLTSILPLTRPGTVIVADNTIVRGEVLDSETTNENVRGIQQFNAALAAEPRVAATIVPMVGMKGYDGMAIAVVRG
jgi:caffeoyl-CoA O-methyltransferase